MAEVLRKDNVPQPPVLLGVDRAPAHTLIPDPVRTGGQRVLLPQRTQVEVVVQQLPLQLPAPGPDQLLQLIVVIPPARPPERSSTRCSKQIRDSVKGSGAEGVAYGSIGLFFLVR